MWNDSKYISYFRFFQIVTLYFDDCFSALDLVWMSIMRSPKMIFHQSWMRSQSSCHPFCLYVPNISSGFRSGHYWGQVMWCSTLPHGHIVLSHSKRIYAVFNVAQDCCCELLQVCMIKNIHQLFQNSHAADGGHLQAKFSKSSQWSGFASWEGYMLVQVAGTCDLTGPGVVAG